MAERLRARFAGVLGCAADDVALTGSTTDGVNTVLAGLDLRPGDEVLTTDEEHPGVLAPLALARARRGIAVRVVPWDELAGAVGARTRLVACSHVSWVNGKLIDAAGLRATGVSVLLDGAQALGAVPVDVEGLGVDFYAASGQKWLCGPDGTGVLYVRPERRDDVAVSWPSYSSLDEPGRPLDLLVHLGGARYESSLVAGSVGAWALASLDVLEEAGWSWVLGRAAELAAGFASRLRERGLAVAERGRSTLVSWAVDDPDAVVASLLECGFAVRSIPGERGLVRASIGAWSSEDELERLAGLVA